MRPIYALPILLPLLLLLLAGRAVAEPPTDAGRVVTYSAWSPEALYLAIRVDDPLVVGNQTLPLSQPWQDDAVAVYLDFNRQAPAQPNDQCVRIIISAAGGATVQRGSADGWQEDPAWFPRWDRPSPLGTIRYGVKLLPEGAKINDSATPDKGYQVELALSWKLLQVLAPIRQRQGDPLPSAGFALACYSQGETTAVSCWPPVLTEDTLGTPTAWGRLQFEQDLNPGTVEGNVASATLLPGSPLIDGTPQVAEWLTAGVTIFPKRWGQMVAPAEPSAQVLSLLAAWYQLDAGAGPDGHQPMDPPGVWGGPEQPLYHLLQIRDVRRTGIDALAVALPADPAAREQTRQRLRALLCAVRDYDGAAGARFLFDAPLLMPVVDLEGPGAPDVRTPAGQQAVQAVIGDFYRMVPPQYRLMVPDERRHLCYPVLLTAPASGAPQDPAFLTEMRSRAIAEFGAPLGWMLDPAWTGSETMAGVLTRCAWDTGSGLQTGSGPLVTAMITPGCEQPRAAYLPRRTGEIYENGWMKITTLRPDFVLVRSWNDFAHGTEIAASRQFGPQFLDSTKLATMRLAEGQGFGIRVLNHTLPATLHGGDTYPVEVLLKNGSIRKLITRQGFRVDYRVMQNKRKVLGGTATEEMVLLELATARIGFPITMGQDKRHPLPPGDYELCLDFRRNKVPFVNLPLMTETLGTVTLPFTVADTAPVAQLVHSDVPESMLVGSSPDIALQVRNASARAWRKGKVAVRLSWDGKHDGIDGNTTITCTDSVPIGHVATFTGKAPAVPGAGWHTLRVELTGASDKPVPVQSVLVQVTAAQVRALFLSVGLPGEIADGVKQLEVPVALRNAGLSGWSAKDTRITYQWLAWDGRPLEGANGSAPLTEDVPPGGATTLRAVIAVPPVAGSYRCAFGLTAAGETAELTTHPLEMFAPVYATNIAPARFTFVDLEQAWNDYGAHADTVMMKANLDGHGNAFPLEEFLPDATTPAMGYQPNYGLGAPVAGAAGFRFPVPQRGLAPLVRADGQAIPLPEEQGTALHLAAMTSGDKGPVTVIIRYKDGTETPATVNISNWWDSSPSFGEPLVLRTHHLHTDAGDDWYLQGSVFAYRLPLDASRPLAALVLPKSTQVAIFAITIEHAAAQ